MYIYTHIYIYINISYYVAEICIDILIRKNTIRFSEKNFHPFQRSKEVSFLARSKVVMQSFGMSTCQETSESWYSMTLQNMKDPYVINMSILKKRFEMSKSKSSCQLRVLKHVARC